MKDSELVVVSRFRSEADAEVAQGILDELSIESLIRSDNAGGMIPALAEAELLVRAEESERAVEALERRHRRLDIADRVKGSLEKAFGYQGDNMNLPVGNLSAALPFYEDVLGFRVESRSESPHNSAVLARDQVQMRLAENGGDPAQDGCAFHVTELRSLLA